MHNTTMFSAVKALTAREALRTSRMPAVIVQSVVFPAVLLLTLMATFGSAVEATSQGPYVQRILPGMLISGAAFGSVGVIIGLFVDRQSGFFRRLRSMPLAKSDNAAQKATLISRYCSEVIRVLFSTVILVLVGSAFGFRFNGSFLETIGFWLLAILCGSSFCWFGFYLALRGKTVDAVTAPVMAIFLLFMFVSEGTVPIEAFPEVVQPFVSYAPMSMMMAALKKLADGQAWSMHVMGALGWSTVISVVFGYLAFNTEPRD